MKSLILPFFLLFLLQLPHSAHSEDCLASMAGCNLYQFDSADYLLGKDRVLLTQQATESASRVSLWRDIVEGSKITALGMFGYGTVGVLNTFLYAQLFPDGYNWLFNNGVVFGLFAGISYAPLCGLMARWGYKKEKLTWRDLVKPTTVLVGGSLVLPTLAIAMDTWYEDLMVALCIAPPLFIGVSILGYIYGKRQPMTQAVQVRPNGLSVRLTALFGTSDD